MGVKALYYSEREGFDVAIQKPHERLFSSKADADARDRTIEFAEELRHFLTRKVTGLDEDMADQISLVLAEDRALLQKALKKPSLLNEPVIQEATPKPSRSGHKRTTKRPAKDDA